jgi:hypothetical protein
VFLAHAITLVTRATCLKRCGFQQADPTNPCPTGTFYYLTTELSSGCQKKVHQVKKYAGTFSAAGHAVSEASEQSSVVKELQRFLHVESQNDGASMHF